MLALNDELLDTVHGASLAGSVKLGFSQDFAETVLPTVLSKFRSSIPSFSWKYASREMRHSLKRCRKANWIWLLPLDKKDRPTAQRIGELELVWIAGQDFTARSGQPLPLVLLGPQCAFRKKAIEKLDEASIPWRIAAVSPSLAGLWASAIGGLGITARTGAWITRQTGIR